MNNKMIMIAVAETTQEASDDISQSVAILCEAIKLDHSNISLEPTRKAIRELEKMLDFLEVIKDK